jgi:hypothetical protein
LALESGSLEKITSMRSPCGASESERSSSLQQI